MFPTIVSNIIKLERLGSAPYVRYHSSPGRWVLYCLDFMAL